MLISRAWTNRRMPTTVREIRPPPNSEMVKTSLLRDLVIAGKIWEFSQRENAILEEGSRRNRNMGVQFAFKEFRRRDGTDRALTL
jgi:hypothetical protein